MPERSEIPRSADGSPDRSVEDPASLERQCGEQERELTIEFFRLVNAADSLPHLVDAAVTFFRQYSQCEAVGIRLRRGSDFPYYQAVGFVEQPLVFDKSPRDCLADEKTKVTLECGCGEVVSGHFDSAQPNFTPQGSFWTNCARQDQHVQNSRCSKQGCQSIALISLKAGKDRIGFLQLNDKRPNLFTLERIQFWESLAGHLAVALARYSAEETLRESEQRLMQAVNIARLGIFEHDHHSGVSHKSQAFRRIYGLADEAAITREQVFSRVFPEDREALESALGQSLDPASDGLLQREHRILHPDGVRWVFVRAQTFFEDDNGARRPARTVGAIIDVTGTKQAELELTASRQQLRTALNAANFGVWNNDLETNTITGDSLAHSIFGLPEDAVLSLDSLLSYIHPDDRPRFLDDRAQLQTCNISLNGEYRIRISDGSIRWVAIWGNQVRDPSGKPVRLTGIILDITGRKHSEEKLKCLEEQFRHAQKMEAIGRLAGAVAHDFNNLLMVIRSYAEIMEDSLPPLDAMRRNTQAIMKATDRAASLTGQMLAFSRKQVLSPVALNLNSAVTESAKMLQRLIGENIELRVALDPGLWSVRADPDQVAQVLMNLSVNSRDAMPVGGVLTLATRNVTVGPSLDERYPFITPGDYAVISVTDTGTGISQEVQERMFEPFFTTKSVGKGTGLGLSTVYGIIKQSGGYLLCDSQPGRGATFSVYLPRIAADRVGDHPINADRQLRGTETILVVEDEDALRNSIRQFLTGLGYTVLAAGSGQQALAIAGNFEQPIHLMITDIAMPKMSGHELSQALAEMRPEIKTVFMSGYIDDASVRRGVQMEGVAFLQKPFSLGLLAHKLRELLR